MIKPIYIYGSQVLRAENEEISLDDKEAIEALLTDLRDTLAYSDGVGLAAPQIGVNKRVVIVNGDDLKETYPELAGWQRTLINPIILDESTKMCEFEEGCLSVPGVYGVVRRPATMTVEYYNENLELVTEEFKGFGCRMVQHELDHLEGGLFVDHIAPLRKKMVSKKLANIERGKVSTKYKTKQ